MRLNAPKQAVFWIAVVIGVLGIISPHIPMLGAIAAYSFWLVVGGWALLVAGNTLKGF